jgi:tetratricopeptide (TPR) repeat protein
MFKQLCILLAVWAAVTPFALAQSILDTPRPSQHAQVSQRIGITDITVNYSRPLVNNRKIWGTLVPYGEVWRAGANENTTISFSDPVTIEGKPLAKGVYGLHMIPNADEWTVIFSKNSSAWGSFTYNQAEDALRVNIKPQTTDFHEALLYDFDAVKPESGVLSLKWEKVSVPINIGVDVNQIVAHNLPDQLRGGVRYTWEAWDEAANYLLDHNLSLEDALADSNHSIQVEERFDNLVTKEQILDKLGRKDEAKAVEAKALGMGNPLQIHTYGRQLQIHGQQDRAFQIFRVNMQKNPDNWLTHSEAARISCASGDYDKAVKEMQLSADNAPPDTKSYMQMLVRRLQAKEDINRQ